MPAWWLATIVIARARIAQHKRERYSVNRVYDIKGMLFSDRTHMTFSATNRNEDFPRAVLLSASCVEHRVLNSINPLFKWPRCYY